MSSENTHALYHEGVLTLGFLLAVLGIWVAYTNPATGYELSIYRATPTAFWLGIAGGFVAALSVGVSAPTSRRLLGAGALLATICGVAVFALPVLRSYFYYGSGDSLTHLGWAREVMRGVIPPTGIIYPGIHLLGIFTADLLGRDLTDGLQLVTLVVFPLVYVLFTGLCVRALTTRRWALFVGIVSAVLFVPINEISVHANPHPSSQAILFAPLAFYVLIRFLTADTDGFPLTTAPGFTLVVVLFGLLFVHPQETLSFVSVLGAVWLVQLLVGRWYPDHEIASHNSVLGHWVVAGAATVVWVSLHDRANSRVTSLINGLIATGPTTLDGTAQRAASLTDLGGSVETMFLKLFGGSLVFCLLAGILLLGNLRGAISGWNSRRNALVTYLMAGLVPLTIGFGLVFVSNQGDHYFRYFGFIMVPVTMLGAVALAELPGRAHRRLADVTDRVSQTASDGGKQTVPEWLRLLVAVLFVPLLAMQLVVIHSSPYMYQSNKQVTEHQMAGHSIAFQYHDGETPMLGVRGGVGRYVDAEYGAETASTGLDFPGYGQETPGYVFNTNLSTYYEEDGYFVLTAADYRRELDLYRGFRYNRSGFAAFRHNPNRSRVQTNGEFTLYRIE